MVQRAGYRAPRGGGYSLCYGPSTPGGTLRRGLYHRVWGAVAAAGFGAPPLGVATPFGAGEAPRCLEHRGWRRHPVWSGGGATVFGAPRLASPPRLERGRRHGVWSTAAGVATPFGAGEALLERGRRGGGQPILVRGALVRELQRMRWSLGA
ncbi:hypothetical protein LZ554_007670 [Drepanopeziza brunnea f. sp. 'monogermtubi']|nr:hypothetical protein LZ554_007669 [Drepanopeziza brunnea f. sp. 'monogermtubi']KAI9048839.1 hypothetical protein LZ554_007670 [Drepanopeziza brunnea f. sp. 'monogermtubi']